MVKDKLAYFGRWPSRQYRLIDASFSAAPISDRAQTYSVRFDYEFIAENETKRASGLGQAELLLKLIRDGEIIIISENGRVLRRD